MDLLALIGLHAQKPVEDPDALIFLPDSTADEWIELLKHSRQQHFAAGEVLFRPTQSQQAFHIILSGKVEVIPEKDRKHPLRLAPGSVFGVQSFFDGNPLGATVTATQDGEMACIDCAIFHALTATNPQLALKVMCSLSTMLTKRLRQSRECTWA